MTKKAIKAIAAELGDNILALENDLDAANLQIVEQTKMITGLIEQHNAAIAEVANLRGAYNQAGARARDEENRCAEALVDLNAARLEIQGLHVRLDQIFKLAGAAL